MMLRRKNNVQAKDLAFRGRNLPWRQSNKSMAATLLSYGQ
jgi:hypothetical protein